MTKHYNPLAFSYANAFQLSTLSALCMGLAIIISPQTASAESNDSSKISCEKAGPQAPRDITKLEGSNPNNFTAAPPASELNLCNIHFHRFAEHRASGYTDLAGKGKHRGYVCNGKTPTMTEASETEAQSKTAPSCKGISNGDTVEVHWVYTSCDVKPGPTLGSCLTPTCTDPLLRVEARVFYLTDDKDAGDFAKFTDHKSGKVSPPPATKPVQYLGATTGNKYNDNSCSPFKVTWRVSSQCTPLNLQSLNNWCAENDFKEDHAHGVRHLVENEKLLSPIK